MNIDLNRIEEGDILHWPGAGAHSIVLHKGVAFPDEQCEIFLCLTLMEVDGSITETAITEWSVARIL